MPKANIKVYVRFRPSANESELIKYPGDGSTVLVSKRPGGGEIRPNAGVVESTQFSFDGVFDSGVSQETIYSSAAQEVVSNVLAGINGTIFAYGQTGAGKTFTMGGDVMSYPHRGVIPRSLHQIFQEVELRVDKSYRVSVSYLEIYNECMYDLLSDKPGASGDLQVIEDGGQTRIVGLRQVEVRSEEEALSQFFLGEQMRSTSDHVLNKNSSRSHCIFTVYVEVKTSSSISEKAITSKLHLVDLAGSERVKRTNATGQVLLEAQYINKSLTFLEQVVQSLGRRDNHVPYRQTKLTSVLRDSLGGNCRTLMFANVWKDDQFAEESISTLRFATRVRLLQTEPIVNESSDPEFLIRKYQRQVRELKQELAMRDSLAGRSFVNYADATDAEMAELRALLQRFLDGDVDVNDIPVESLKRIRETFTAFRYLYLNLKTDMENKLTEAKSRAPGSAADPNVAAKAALTGTSVRYDDDALVGEVDRTGGIHIGQAPAGARPAEIINSPGASRPMTRAQSVRQPGGPPQGLMGTVNEASEHSLFSVGVNSALDANGAYFRYRNQVHEGIEINTELKRATEELKEARMRLKDCSAAVNATKAEIDDLTAKVEEKKAEAAAARDDVTDSEQYEMVARLKEAKLRYRSEFTRYKEVRTEADALQGQIAEKKQALLDGFNEWMAAQGMGGMGLEGTKLFADTSEGMLEEPSEAMMGDASQTAYLAAMRTLKRNMVMNKPGPTRR